ncbi:Na+/H+ antiporter NhaC family protein, partial [Balneolaceae bacterium ANBcel3]|nr:Na+/H+ antiporter NhaC family protein [Balneolaceae bacterium ANBcel3]
WLDAVLPIAGLVAVTIAGLLITGEGDSIRDIIGTADSYAALVWGSAFSLFLAIVLTLSRKLLSAQEIQKSMFRGMHVMFEGGIILVLAWSLGMVTIHLDTAGFLVSLLEGTVNPYWLPVVMFVIAGFTSFATGSSWGTMGIITPIVVPLAWTLSLSHGLDPQEAHTILYGGVSAVLAGAVWGDHCSPVSDTTILSSLACQCDHIAHVNTQLPYALLVGGFAIVSLVASMVAGLSLWIIYPSMLVFMLLAVYLLGKPVDEIRT